MVRPGLEPPPGMTSNFENPDKHMYYISIVSNSLAIPVCTVFVILRFLARYRLAAKVSADDVACLVGYLGFMGYCSICLLMLRYGGGLHQWDVPEDQITGYYKTVYATMVNYGPTAFATKAAILLFLTRVFSPYKTYVRWIYGFLGVMAAYYIIMFGLKVGICRPISMFWGETTPGGVCFNQRLLILVDNVISLVSDLVVLLLPCPLTSGLQINTMAKIKIGVVFGVGGIACVFSLFRLILIVNNGSSPDQTYAFVEINLTGIAECGIGIVCACFPLMPALWKSIFGRDKSTGYSYPSGSKSQFEMMGSSKKNSRAATHDRGTIIYGTGNRTKNEIDSDENTLIGGPGKTPYVTTRIHGGADEDDEFDIEGRSSTSGGGPVAGSGAGAGGGRGQSRRRDASFDEAHIVRTVEVRQQYEEQ